MEYNILALYGESLRNARYHARPNGRFEARYHTEATEQFSSGLAGEVRTDDYEAWLATTEIEERFRSRGSANGGKSDLQGCSVKEAVEVKNRETRRKAHQRQREAEQYQYRWH